MAEPTEKSPAINDLLSKLAGRDRVESIKSDDCVACGEPATEFNDEISEREFKISGLCQDCQDDFFGT